MNRPGGQIAALPLHFVWIADCSGSMMAHGKMASLNQAAREAVPQMRKVAEENPNAEVFVRLLRFANGAEWVDEQPTPLQYFRWPELTAVPGGRSDLGAALKVLARELRPDAMHAKRSLPPAIVLMTDGYPTDDFAAGLDALMQEPWGAKAVRIGLMIGNESSEVLRRFIGNPQIEPLRARNAEELIRHIRWASTSVLQAASSPRVDNGAELRPPAANEPGSLVTW
jgi:uncharacterized protein YegL